MLEKLGKSLDEKTGEVAAKKTGQNTGQKTWETDLKKTGLPINMQHTLSKILENALGLTLGKTGLVTVLLTLENQSQKNWATY